MAVDDRTTRLSPVRGVAAVRVSDAALIRRTRNGDSEAFRTLVERHYPGCIRYAMRMLGNRPDAEEAVQDTFIRVYRSIDRYEDRGRFGGWLYRILVNRCRSTATRASRRARRLRVYQTEPRRRYQPAPSLETGELERIQTALGKLPPDQREAFLLKYVEELTYEEMSTTTGASVSALKMRVKRARERLQSHLRGYYDDDEG